MPNAVDDLMPAQLQNPSGATPQTNSFGDLTPGNFRARPQIQSASSRARSLFSPVATIRSAAFGSGLWAPSQIPMTRRTGGTDSPMPKVNFLGTFSGST